MRKYAIPWLAALLALMLCVSVAETVPDVSGVQDAALPVTDGDVYADDQDYPGFVGRLYIDDVGIDVALYNSNAQAVVDRFDSAAYFDLPTWRGHYIIGDHNNQSFRALHDVQVGMVCCIRPPDGEPIYYECVRVFNGINTGKYIAEENGRICMADADLLMYTCRMGWRYVRVCLWDRCEPPEDLLDQEVTRDD